MLLKKGEEGVPILSYVQLDGHDAVKNLTAVPDM